MAQIVKLVSLLEHGFASLLTFWFLQTKNVDLIEALLATLSTCFLPAAQLFKAATLMLVISKSLLQMEQQTFPFTDDLCNQIEYLLSNNQLLLNTHSFLFGILYQSKNNNKIKPKSTTH